MGFQVINNPCLYQGHRHLLGKPGPQRLLAGIRHSCSSVYIRSSVIPCLQQQKLIHTSGRGVGSASSAGKLQRSDSWAVCGIGAWASTIHAAVRVLDSEFPPLVSSPGCPTSWEAVPHGSRQQLQEGSVDHKPRVRTSGTGQRDDQTWPISSSVPRFSFGIS